MHYDTKFIVEDAITFHPKGGTKAYSDCMQTGIHAKGTLISLKMLRKDALRHQT